MVELAAGGPQGQFSNAQVEAAYSRLVLESPRVESEDLAYILATNDPFAIREEGGSHREHIRRGLKALAEASNRLAEPEAVRLALLERVREKVARSTIAVEKRARTVERRDRIGTGRDERVSEHAWLLPSRTRQTLRIEALDARSGRFLGARIIDSRTGEQLALEEPVGANYPAAYRWRDGHYAVFERVAHGPSWLFIFDALTGKRVAALNHPGVIDFAVPTPNGQKAMVQAKNSDGQASWWLFDFKSNAATLISFQITSTVLDVWFDPSGEKLFLLGSKGKVDVLDVKSGTLVNFFPERQDLYTTKRSPDGRLLAFQHYDRIVVMDVLKQQEAATFAIPFARRGQGMIVDVNMLTFSPSGRFLAFTNGEKPLVRSATNGNRWELSGSGPRVRPAFYIFDIEAGKFVRKAAAPKDLVDLVFVDETAFVTRGKIGHLRRWEIDSLPRGSRLIFPAEEIP